MEEDSYAQSPDSVHRVHRRDSPRSSSRPTPYHRHAISSSPSYYQHDTSRETNSSSGSDDNLTWATEELKTSFRNVYRKHGSLQERRALNKKYKHIGCDQCAAKGIQCDVGDTALRCGQCPAYVKCTRIAILKQLRVIDIMDIPKEQYDWLLRWYKKDKEDELLEPLKDTFAKASMAVSQITESSAQPKPVKPRVQNPYPPSAPLVAESERDSRTTSQNLLETGNTRTVSPETSEHVALDEYASYSSLGSNHSDSSSEAHEMSGVAQTSKSMAARTDFGTVDIVPKNFLDVSSPYALSPLSLGPSSPDNSNSPDSSVYYQNAPTPADNSPSPYRSPHLCAPVPLARFHSDSLLRYGHSRDAEISSSNNISNTTLNSGHSSTTLFSLNNPYPVTWNVPGLSTDGGAQTVVSENSRIIGNSQYSFDFGRSFESDSQHLATTHSEDVYPQTIYQISNPYNLSRQVTGTPLLPQSRPLVEVGTSSYYMDNAQYLRQGYYQNQSPWEDRLNCHQTYDTMIASHGDGQSLPLSLRRASGT